MWKLQKQSFFHDIFFDLLPIVPEGMGALIAPVKGFLGGWGSCDVLFFISPLKLFGLEVVLISGVVNLLVCEGGGVEVAEVAVFGLDAHED